MWKIRELIVDALSSVFPPTCINCHLPNTSLCSTCLQRCRLSIDTNLPFCISVYSFKDTLIKKIIHAIKYFHRKDLVKPLVDSMLPHLLASDARLFSSGDWVLVPIPMPSLRKYIRGYNQAEILAKEFGKQLHVPVDTTLLARKNKNKRQVMTKSRSERIHNQRNSFTLIRTIVPKKIILIDDVTTTGATLMEARTLLLQQGADEVKALTIAH